jgi:hypothetical protein
VCALPRAPGRAAQPEAREHRHVYMRTRKYIVGCQNAFIR